MTSSVPGLCAFFLVLSALSVRADDRALPPSAHRYALGATLDPAQKRVHGEAHITFTNTSAQPLRKLVLHLYLNAFRDEHSVFMRESGGFLRGHTAEGRGEIVLTSLRVDGQEKLPESERELVPGDRTQLRVPLARPLAPGATVALDSTFEVQLPPLFARSGYVDGFYAVAQWFPKLAKLEPDGRFASFPYHALGEFYADFADYTLTVTTPAALSVAASGTLVETRHERGLVTRRFEAAHVHDVAFVAARGFVETVEQVGAVRVSFLAPPGYAQAVRTHAVAVRAGLEHYARRLGPYPYATLTVALPPRTAVGAAGMEYPTLIVTAGPWLGLDSLPTLSGAFVTAHELAHQWFYGILASDEVHFPVLDEGLTQWASLDLMRHVYGAREGLLGVSIERFEAERLLATRLVQSTAPGLAAYAYTPAEYGASVYARAALALESIRRAHGDARFRQALALYTRHQRFVHPTPDDLAEAFDAAYGEGFSAHTLRPLLLDGETSAVHLAEARTTEGTHGSRTRLRARRTGTVALPTWAALYGADGRELTRIRFPSESATLLATVETTAPVARVVLDPERALLLDDDVSDQVADLRSQGASTLLARVLAVLQLVSGWVGP